MTSEPTTSRMAAASRGRVVDPVRTDHRGTERREFSTFEIVAIADGPAVFGAPFGVSPGHVYARGLPHGAEAMMQAAALTVDGHTVEVVQVSTVTETSRLAVSVHRPEGEA